MRITNTYLDGDKDIWWKLGKNVFFRTYAIFRASRSAEVKFNSWVSDVFNKIEIGTKHD